MTLAPFCWAEFIGFYKVREKWGNAPDRAFRQSCLESSLGGCGTPAGLQELSEEFSARSRILGRFREIGEEVKSCSHFLLRSQTSWIAPGTFPTTLGGPPGSQPPLGNFQVISSRNTVSVTLPGLSRTTFFGGALPSKRQRSRLGLGLLCLVLSSLRCCCSD